jgi:hypothetical protein
MMLQNRDGPLTKELTQRWLGKNQRQGYYAAVPAHLLDDQSSVIEQLISFAFDTLGAWCLEVRVYNEDETNTILSPQRPPSASGGGGARLTGTNRRAGDHLSCGVGRALRRLHRKRGRAARGIR